MGFQTPSTNTSSLHLNQRQLDNVSRAVRAEFARGDGRTKTREERRKGNIPPCDTLFVVNFKEDTTKRQDLEMIFKKYGELVGIDMRKNFAFVQFKNIDDAKRAKDETDGGMLEQCMLSVEFSSNRNRGYSGGGRDRRRRSRSRSRGRYRSRYDRRSRSRSRGRYRSRSRSRGRYRSRSPYRRDRSRDRYDDRRRERHDRY